MSEEQEDKKAEAVDATAAPEDWEAGAHDEPSGGKLAPSDELEAALREATEAVDARTAGAVAGGSAATSLDKATIEALSNELQELKVLYEDREKQLDEANDKHLRLQAEFENFRRRGLKERQEAHAFGHQNLVKDLLAVVDNLDRAIEHTEQSAGADLEALLQGVELVRREFLAGLANHGVREVEAEGQPFDPTYHEAMAQAPSEDVEPNHVLQVLQKGYVLHDRMLRPARVIVAVAPQAAGDGGSSGSSES